MARAGSERPPAGAADALPGASETATFGKYKLFASLGRGGMADVFLAIARGPLGFNKLVVVKRLRSALADDPSFLGMFLDEARLAARLNHPNVVHTYEVDEHDGSFFIAMEYLEGQSLNRVIKDLAKRNEELDEGICARIIADALAGLHHAHTLKDYDGTPLDIVHRDVSPHNVFVTYDGQVKLVDFGIAKAALSSTVTEVGVLKGKVAYMAPEQAMGAPIDRRADIFGMGIVLWELLARRRLLAGDTVAATLHRLLNEPIPLITSARDVDAGLAAIVMRALEKSADRRYQTAQDMRDAIEEWIRVTGRKVRQEAIGERLGAMYQDVRSEVKRQVQQQMALAAASSSSGDIAAANDSGRTPVSGASGAPPRPPRLPEIGVGSGSGSGVVRLGELPPPSGEELAPEPEPRRRSITVLFVLALLLALGGVAFLLVKIAFSPKDAVVADLAASATSPSPSTSAPTPTSTSTSTSTSTPTSTSIPTSTSAVAPSASTPLAPTRTPIAPPATPPRAATASPSGPDDVGPGFLTFDTYPWTRVSEGGRLLGTTPLIKIPMTPGTHTLVLENPEQAIKKNYVVSIKSGETFSMRLGLSK